MRLRPVAVDQFGGDRIAAPGQEEQELVVQAGRRQCLLQFGLDVRVVAEHRDHRGILVAEQELQQPVLRRLETRGLPEQVAELGVFAGGEGGQHRPLVGHLLLDVLDPGQPFQCRPQLVGRDQRHGGAQLVDDQLHPEFGGLVLDDEQHLVVPVRQRDLRAEQLVEVQVAAVVEPAQVCLDALFERADVRTVHGTPFVGDRRHHSATT